MSTAGDLSSLAWKHMPCSHFTYSKLYRSELEIYIGKGQTHIVLAFNGVYNMTNMLPINGNGHNT